MKFDIAILKNELDTDHLVWVDSCKKNDRIGIIDVIDLTSDNWLGELKKRRYDALLLKPSGIFAHLKQLYDERVIIIYNSFDSLIYPSLNELLIYENKRFLRDWLMAKDLPHPATFVFYNKNEARKFLLARSNFPIVGKTNIGASGNGVRLLLGRPDAISYVQEAFSKGIYTRTGPNFSKGSLLKKIRKGLIFKGFIKKRVKQYSDTLASPQKNFVIFQEFIPHQFEWRCVKIGDSYFAHKKIAVNNKASGTLLKSYVPVPLSLLDFIRDVTLKSNLTSVAIDVFEKDGQYLINEIQCIFGQSDPYQMLIDKKPGRYIRVNDKWIFEEGSFNTNQSYDLRIEHVVSLLDKRSEIL